ncbi:MAG: hypothetical protein ACFFD7_11050 [Candidatus Thorarchaeota archaeon]
MSIYEQIKDILLEHKGKKKAITSREIAKQVGEKWGVSGGNIRPKITETIQRYQLPVASHTNKGYFFMTNKKDLNNYLKTLDSYITKITNRKAYISVFYYRYYKDETLELTGEIFEGEDDDQDETGDMMEI